MVGYLKRAEDVPVTWHYVTTLWCDSGLNSRRRGAFNVSKDPAFA
jgi:hypothetical protein